MLQSTEALRHPNRTTMWLGATVGAVIVGLWLTSSLSHQDGIYWFVAGVDLALSFIFYPFGLLQLIFLNLIGELAFEDASQLTPLKILGLVLVFRRFIDLAFRQKALKVVKAPPLVWALLFVLSLGLSIFVSQDITESLMVLFTYIQLLIMFSLVIDFVRGEREIKYLLVVFILSSLVNAGFAIYQSYFEISARAGGAIGNPNRFGIIQLVLLCLIASVVGLPSIRWPSSAIWLAFGPIVYSILLSFSRSAFVTTVVVLLYYLLFVRSGGVRPKVALTMVILTGLILAPEGFYDRIDTIPTALSGTRLYERSIPTRLLYYKAGIQMGLDHPLVGIGLGQFNRHIATYANLHTVKPMGAHNMYVSVFAEAGSIGFIAFLGLLATCFMAARGRQRRSSSGTKLQMAFASSVELGNVALLIGGLFATLEYSKVLWMLLAFATSVQQMSISKKKNDDAMQDSFRFG